MVFAQTTDTLVYSSPDVTTSSTTLFIFSGFWLFVWLAVAVILIIAQWRIFVKAGEAGWKCLIPLYNMYTLFRIAGRNGWWFLGLLVPFVNIVVSIILAIDLAKHFGKSTVFGVVGLWLFSVIGYLILGFDDSKYVGQKHA